MKGKYSLTEHCGELICQFLQHYYHYHSSKQRWIKVHMLINFLPSLSSLSRSSLTVSFS